MIGKNSQMSGEFRTSSTIMVSPSNMLVTQATANSRPLNLLSSVASSRLKEASGFKIEYPTPMDIKAPVMNKVIC